MKRVASIDVNLAALRAVECAGPLFEGTTIARYITEPDSIDEKLRALLTDNDTCTVVYHACGTCANGGALVEYFCSSGGSQPDYTDCEGC